MEIDEAEALANEIDAHCLALIRGNGTQAAAIAWMTKAYNLLEQCSKDMRRSRVFAVHTGFGCATYTLERPAGLVIPKKAPEGFFDPHPIWMEGKTVQYGDRYQNRNVPWTQADTRKLVAQREREKAKLK